MSNDFFSNLLSSSRTVIKGAANSVGLSQLAINFVVSAGLSTLLNTISALHIMCFMSMMALLQPANLQFFLAIFVDLVNLDIIDPEWSTALIFDFSYDENYA